MNRDFELAGAGRTFVRTEGISTERTLELIPSVTISESGKSKPSYLPLAAGQLIRDGW